MKETIKKFGRTFERVGPNGGWLEHGAKLPDCSTAIIAGDAYVFAEAAKNMYGGAFHGGVFHGGEFYGGEFRDGWFRGGEFRDGWFRGGEFYGGAFRGGEFYDGAFSGGVFRGGVFRKSPSCAQRSDGYMFVAKVVDGELRIWAGCRNFSWEEAVAHWNEDHPHGAESQRIIHFLKAQEEANA